ncbi:MAG: hypothetical protein ABIV51_08615 [Saprospiraceae bacterium]
MKAKLIDIKFNEEKPSFFGDTGLHLYSVNARHDAENIIVEILADAKAFDLYKIYQELAIFLSDKVNPLTSEKDIRTFAIFGNPEHSSAIVNRDDDLEDYQIVGYLDRNDLINLAGFLNSIGFDNQDNAQEYFDSLREEVREELEILLDDSVMEELYLYLEPMLAFYNECILANNEVVIIVNS